MPRLTSLLSSKRRDGFTLVQMVITVVIIGIIVTMATVAMRDSKDKANERRIRANIIALNSAAERALLDGFSRNETANKGIVGTDPQGALDWYRSKGYIVDKGVNIDDLTVLDGNWNSNLPGLDQEDIGATVADRVATIAAPRGDSFEDALEIILKEGVSVYPGNNAGATTEPNEPDPDVTKSVWYKFTGATLGTVTITAPDSSFPPVLGLFIGQPIMNAAYISGGDSIKIEVTPGTVYYLRVASGPTDAHPSGAYRLTFDYAPIPLNDDFINASEIVANGGSGNGTTYGATIEPTEPSTGGSTVWFKTEALGQGQNVTLRVSQYDFPVTVDAYTGTSLEDLRHLGTTTNDTPLTVHGVTGTRIYFRVSGTSAGTAGSYYISTTSEAVEDQGPPYNDNFAKRIILPPTGSDVRNLTHATRETGEPTSTQSSMWYSVSTAGSGTLQVTVTAPMRVYAYTGDTLQALQPVGNGGGSTLEIPVPYQNSTYRLQVTEGENGEKGTATVTVAFYRTPTATRPQNDDFEYAILLPKTGKSIAVDTTNATIEAQEDRSEFIKTVWYKVVGFKGHLLVDAETDSGFKPAVGIYYGSSITNLIRVAFCPGTADGGCGPLGIETVLGRTYYIRVGTPPSIPGKVGSVRVSTVGTDTPVYNNLGSALLLEKNKVTNVTSLYADIEPGEDTSCGDSRSVWFKMSHPTAGIASFKAFVQGAGSGFTPKFRAYKGPAQFPSFSNLLPVGLTNCVAGTDPDVEPITWRLHANEVYYFRVAGDSGGMGNFSVVATWDPLPDGIADNDDFGDAAPISLEQVVTGSIQGATKETNEPAFGGANAGLDRSVWYRIDATPGWLYIKPSDFTFAGQIDVYTSSNIDPAVSRLSLQLTTPASAPEAELLVTGPQRYYIRVSNMDGNEGLFKFTTYRIPFPSNDPFSGADVGTSFIGDNYYASVQGGEPAATGPTTWHKYIPVELTGTVTVNQTSTSGTFTVASTFYQGTSLGALTPVSSLQGDGTYRAHVEMGKTYYIRVTSTDIAGDGRGETGRRGGSYSISTAFSVMAVNDDFGYATPLPVSNGSDAGDSYVASAEAGEPSLPAGSTSVWYKLTGITAEGQVSFVQATSDVRFALKGQLFSGTAINGLTEVASAEGSTTFKATVLPGNTYYYRVSAASVTGDGTGSSGRKGGPFTVATSFHPRPVNDNFTKAIPIEKANYSSTVDFYLATNEPNEVTGCGSAASVWYKFVAPAPGYLQVALDFVAGSGSTNLWGVFQGTTVSTLTQVGACGPPVENRKAPISYTVLPNQTYYIRLATDSTAPKQNVYTLNTIFTYDATVIPDAPTIPVFTNVTANSARITAPAMPPRASTLDLQRSSDGTSWTTIRSGMVGGEQYSDTITGIANYFYRFGARNSYTVTWGGAAKPSGDGLADFAFGSGDGIFYFIGTDYGRAPWVNPHTNRGLIVSASAIENGSVTDLVDRSVSNFYTPNVASSYVQFDLRTNRAVVTGIGIRSRTTNNTHPQTIQVSGSNDAETWTNLGNPISIAFSEGSQWNSKPVNGGATEYRYIRVTQVTTNSANNNYFCLGEVELYGSLNYDVRPRVPGAVTFSNTTKTSTTVTTPSFFEAAASFRLERSTNNSSWTTVVQSVGTGVKVPQTGLTEGQIYYYRVVGVNSYGETPGPASAIVPVAISPTAGFAAEYFSDTGLRNLAFTRVDPTIDFVWGPQSPAPGVPSTYYSVRWRAKITPKYTEKYTFYTRADDGTRLWINGITLIDDWTVHGVLDKSATVDLEAGKSYDVVLEYFQGEGGQEVHFFWSSASQPMEIVPSTVAVTNGGPQLGFDAEYFADVSLTNLAVTRQDPNVDFAWAGAAPATGMSGTNFSVRWKAQVIPAYSELYTFFTNADDGTRLWVNGQQLINDWTVHGPTEKSGTITLVAGQKYDLVLEYFQGVSGSEVHLMWQSFRQPKAIIRGPNVEASSIAPSTPGAVSFTAIGTTSHTVILPPLPRFGINFSLQRSTDNVSFTTVASGLEAGGEFAAKGLTAGVNYFYRAVAVGLGGATPGPSRLVDAGDAQNYTSDGDANGIFYYLGTDKGASAVWTNPMALGKLAITTSGTSGVGAIGDIVDRLSSNFKTTNALDSYVQFDLGASTKATLYAYSFRSSFTSSDPKPVGLKISGSNDGVTFKTLGSENSLSIGTGAWYTGNLSSGAGAYRYIRFTQTKSSIPTDNSFAVGEIELYGVVSSSGVPDAPSAPTLSNPTPTSVTLTTPAAMRGAGSFTLQRSTDNVNWTDIATTLSRSQSYTDTGLAAPTTYLYRLVAINSFGRSTGPGVPFDPGSLTSKAYVSDGDTNGVFYYLATKQGTQPWAEPQTNGIIRATASAYASGADALPWLTDRSIGHFHTANAANSWVQFDLGAGTAVAPTAYSIRARDDYNGHFYRNLTLYGSNDGSAWTVLHVATSGFATGPNSWSTVQLPANLPAYRHLRIMQTAPNTTGDNWFIVGEVEFYGNVFTTRYPAVPGAVAFADIQPTSVTIQAPTTLPARTQSLAIQRSTDGAQWVTVRSGLPAGGSATDTGLTTGVTYRYRAVAVNGVFATPGPAAIATTAPVSILTYQNDGDRNGVFYFLGTNGNTTTWTNPFGKSLTTTASAIGNGTLADLSDRNINNFHTTDQPNSWVQFDLQSRTLQMDTYSIRTRDYYAGNYPRHFRVEGSNDGSEWSVLDVRSSVSWSGTNEWKTFRPSYVGTFRFFRIVQFSTDSSGYNYLCLGEVEFYGTLNSPTAVPAIPTQPTFSSVTLDSALVRAPRLPVGATSITLESSPDSVTWTPVQTNMMGYATYQFTGPVTTWFRAVAVNANGSTPGLPASPNTRMSDADYSQNGKMEGLFYKIGTTLGLKNWVNPVTAGYIAASASSLGSGNPSWTVDLQTNNFHTGNEVNAWVQYDLKENTSAAVSTYAVRLRSTYLTDAPSSWDLLGSADGVKWNLIDRRSGVSWNSPDQWLVFTSNGPAASQYHRFIRIQITGPNSSGGWYLCFGELELFGTLNVTQTGTTPPETPSSPILINVEGNAVTLQPPAFPLGALRVNIERSTDDVTWTEVFSNVREFRNIVDPEVLPGTLYHYRAVAVNYYGTTAGPSIAAFPGGSVNLAYSSNGDTNGIFYFLGTQLGARSEWINPAINPKYLVASASSLYSGSPTSLTDRAASEVWTQNADQSYFQFDLGVNRAAKLSAYSYRNFSSTTYYPYSFRLQGSNDGVVWRFIDERQNALPGVANQWATFALDASEGFYRFFRLTQVGTNRYGNAYFTAGEIELYGSLQVSEPPLPPGNVTVTSATGTIKLPNKPFSASSLILERSTDNSTWSVVASGLPTQATVTDSSLTPESRYYYRAVAVNAFGSTPGSSKPSWAVEGGTYAAPGDDKGLFYYIGTSKGTTTWENPALNGRVTITASSTPTGSTSSLIDRQPSSFQTADVPSSWVIFDLGKNHYAQLNGWTYRHYTSSNHCTLGMRLEGSNDAANWTLVDQRTGLPALAASGWGAGFAANALGAGSEVGYFRYFRITQIGGNSSGYNNFSLGEIEFYGSYFEANPPDVPGNVSFDVGNKTIQMPVYPFGASSMELEKSSDGASWETVATGVGTAARVIDNELSTQTGFLYRAVAVNAFGRTTGGSRASWTVDGGSYSGPGDKNGLFYNLGTNKGTLPWQNPALNGRVTITASNIYSGTTKYLTDRQTDEFWSANEANSWIQFDLGPNKYAQLTGWTFQKGYNGSSYSPLNYRLQGSNDGKNWVLIDERNNMPAIPAYGWSAGFPTTALGTSTQAGYFRYFRITQTAANAAGNNHMVLSEVEFYGSYFDATPPEVPGNVTIDSVAQTIHMPAFPAGATSMNLERSSDGSTWSTLAESLAPNADVTDTQLSVRNGFLYRALAINQFGRTPGGSRASWTVDGGAYSAPGDKNGLFYYLGTNRGTLPWQNPALNGRVTITTSNIYTGATRFLTDRQTNEFWTSNEANSWVQFDLGPNKYAQLTGWTLQKGYNGSSYSPTNLRLQGSNDGTNWTLIDERNDLPALPAYGWSAGFPATALGTNTQAGYFRFFRITQTALNYAGNSHFPLSEIEFYGSYFEALPPEVPGNVVIDSASGTITMPALSFGATQLGLQRSADNVTWTTIAADVTARSVVTDNTLSPASFVYYRAIATNHIGSTPGGSRASWTTNGSPYESSGDAKGLFYYLGTKRGTVPWENPATNGEVTVTASSIYTGSVTGLLNRAASDFQTQSVDMSWIQFDLGNGRYAQLSAWTYQKGYSGSGYSPINLKLEGSNDGSNWTLVDQRYDLPALPSYGWSQAFPATALGTTTQAGYFRYFRLTQVGGNASSGYSMLVGEVEFYGDFYTTNPPSKPNLVAFPTVTDEAVTVTMPSLPAEAVSLTLEKSVDGINYSTVVSGLTANASYTDEDVVAGKMYYYRAVAVNPNGSTPGAPRTTTAVVLDYVNDGSNKGLVYHMGTRGDSEAFANPQSKGLTVTCSGVYSSSWPISWLTDRADGYFHTTDVANSWIQFDLGANRTLIPTSYGLRNRTDYNGYFPRAVTLYGSNDGATWTTIKATVSGMSSVQGAWNNITLPQGVEAYRYFRVVQTQTNTSGYNYFILAEVEFYGLLVEPPYAPNGLNRTDSTSTSVTFAMPALPANAATLSFERSPDLTNWTTISTGHSGRATVSDTGLTSGDRWYYRAVAVSKTGRTPGPAIGVVVGSTAPLLAFQSIGDSNGLMYYLGTAGLTVPYANPATSGRVAVTASSSYSGNVPANSVDRTAAYWQASTTGGAWLQWDLGATYQFDVAQYVVQWQWANDIYTPIVLAGSNDGTTWTTIDSRSGNTGIVDNVYTVATPGTSYRYLRMSWGGASNWPGIKEVEFYGNLYSK